MFGIKNDEVAKRLCVEHNLNPHVLASSLNRGMKVQ